jgi:hypothetical protein
MLEVDEPMARCGQPLPIEVPFSDTASLMPTALGKEEMAR